jgi:hypothetical protein
MATQDSPASTPTGDADAAATASLLVGGLDAWKELLRTEEARCAELGIGAAILSIGRREGSDTAPPTDDRVVAALAEHLDPTDRVAVLRAGEYGVLLVPVPDRRAAEARATGMYRTLRARGWDLAMGWAMRRDGHGLFHAAAQADAAMLRTGSGGRLDLTARD